MAGLWRRSGISFFRRKGSVFSRLQVQQAVYQVRMMSIDQISYSQERWRSTGNFGGKGINQFKEEDVYLSSCRLRAFWGLAEGGDVLRLWNS